LRRVGNDIVDLTSPDSREKSRDIRFINRVFTQGEKKQILNTANPDGMLWAMWAGKEASYKVVSKSHPAVSSVPRAYEVSFEEDMSKWTGNSSLSGVVETPRGSVPVRIFRTCDSIHCIATTGLPEAVDSVIWGVQHIGSGLVESVVVREAAKRHLSLLLDRDPDEIEIRRLKGSAGSKPPIVYVEGRKAGVDISLSHDGAFAAYAFVTDSSF